MNCRDPAPPGVNERVWSEMPRPIWAIPWRPLKGCGIHGVPPVEALNRSRPPQLDKVLWAAQTLGAPFHFVRVDIFLLSNGGIAFNEFSLYPFGGRAVTYPDSCNKMCGDHFIAPTPDQIVDHYSGWSTIFLPKLIGVLAVSAIIFCLLFFPAQAHRSFGGVCVHCPGSSR